MVTEIIMMQTKLNISQKYNISINCFEFHENDINLIVELSN